MVLLSVLHRLNFKVEVLHVNYQLRENDSDLDEQFVRDFCEKNDIPFHLKKVEYSEGNIQSWARNERYDWFQLILNDSEENFVVLAHHSDDQVETFFLNLARGGGLMGLSGMLENHNRIIRPLLPFSKQEIVQYANENKVDWREDVSNQSLKYSRNKLRNEILPSLQSDFPNLNHSVLTLVDVFQRNQSEIAEKMSPFVNRLKKNEIVSLEEIKQWYSFDWAEVFRQLKIPISQLEEIQKIIELEKGKFIEVNHSDYSAIVREESGISLRKKTLKKYRLEVREVKEIPTVFTKNEIYLDKNKIVGELSIRPWKEGDRIAPVGMKGTQLVSDVIRLSKISDEEKQNCLVLEDEVQIHWVVGLKIGRGALVIGEGATLCCKVFR